MLISAQRKPWRIGEILLHQGWVQGQDLEEALSLQKTDEQKRPIGTILVDSGVISKNVLYQALAIQFGKQFVDLGQVNIQPEALQSISRQFALENNLIPIAVKEGMLLVAVPDPLNVAPLKGLERMQGVQDIEIVLATQEDIQETINRYYGSVVVRLKTAVVRKFREMLRYFVAGEISNF